MQKDISKEIIYYGKNEQSPKPVQLNAGPLNLEYINGYIRYIKLSNLELVRMIYSAVRDQNWGTIEPEIKNEVIKPYSDSFEISYQAEYKEREINFLVNYEIKGNENGSVTFNMEGEALSDFKKNRIGFCILHPSDYAGKHVKITHTTNNKTEGTFPNAISPHQPFKDIKMMKWPVDENSSASVIFEGDIFEMEDQRNWTDDSYKTYCTPLEIKFPAKVKKGDKINQAVSLKLEGKIPVGEKKEEVLQYKIGEDSERFDLPAIGIGKSSEKTSLTDDEINYLKALRFDHYRVDLKLADTEWKEVYHSAHHEAQKLGYSLEIALHFGDTIKKELSAFIDETKKLAPEIKLIQLFHQSEKTTKGELIEQSIDSLREALPNVAIGGGTDAFFTELNRERTPTDRLDFLVYSINPQVHHFDNESLVETLKAQSFTVESTRQFAMESKVHVSPITFKMRWNPNTTGDEDNTNEEILPSQVDTRQLSLFGAGWTIGSIKYLAESKADLLTYFETVGKRGIFMGEAPSDFPETFPVVSFTFYPMYFVFKEVLNDQWQVIPSKSTNRLKVDGLCLAKKGDVKLLLANYTGEKQEIEFERQNALRALVSYYDEHNAAEFMADPTFKRIVEVQNIKNKFKLELNPYAFVIVEFLYL